MQDSTFLPQHRVTTLALTLTLSAIGALGCAHEPAPQPQSARVEAREPMPQRAPQRAETRPEPVNNDMDRAGQDVDRAGRDVERVATEATEDVEQAANDGARDVDRAANGTPQAANGTPQAVAEAAPPATPATTAADQSNEPADLEITRRIRAAVVMDSALSVGARNCTIITRNSVVTLRGNVSRAEQRRIAAHAQAVPGVSRIENHLAVNP